MIHIFTTLALLASAPEPLQTQGQDQDTLATAAEVAALNAKIDALFAEFDERSSSPEAGDKSRLNIGGYGEYHGNFVKDGAKAADAHRFVIYLGYNFSEDVSLHSETEIEHAFVSEGDGVVSIEQLYADIRLTDRSGLRIGRMLNPLGIVNQRHEPSTFNGVERPNLEKFLIPSTWAQDGLGTWGRFGNSMTYELQWTSGLDGSGFTDVGGIRGGRMKEQPGLNDPALSGRFDWRPKDMLGLRLGGSFYSGGANNGNKGSNPDVESRVDILSLDFEYSRGALDLRGVFVQSRITGADELNDAFGGNVGEGQMGWYVEAGYHLFSLLDDAQERRRFPESDLVAFLRLEEYDTLDALATGGSANLAAARRETTIGLGWWLTPNFVLKADYQFLDDDTGVRPNQLNIGVGWTLAH